MIYSNISIKTLITAVKNKYKVMLIYFLIITFLGGALSSYYVYNKEIELEPSGNNIDRIDENKQLNRENLQELGDKIDEVGAYIKAISFYAEGDIKNELIEVEEQLRKDIQQRYYWLNEYQIIKENYENLLAKSEDNTTSLFDFLFIQIYENTLGTLIFTDISNNELEKYYKGVCMNLNENIFNTQEIGDYVVKKENLILHNESKTLTGDGYVYSYFAEKIDIRDSLISVWLFFILFGIVLGYVIGLIKYVSENGGRERT